MIYLQSFGKDGDWHTVEVRTVVRGLDVLVRLDVRRRRDQGVPRAHHRWSGQRRRGLLAGDGRRYPAPVTSLPTS